MGFWQGISSGLAAVQEQKAREKEQRTQIEARKAEIEEQRKYDREMFMLQLKESRRDALLPLLAKRDQEIAESQALTGKAQTFLGRFEGSEDPRVAALASNPRKAAELEEELRSIEIEAAKTGVELPPLKGEALLEMITVYDQKTGAVEPVSITLDDILSGDFTNPEEYYKVAGELSRPVPQVEASLKPEAYRRYDPKVLEEGRKVFDQEILRLANEALKNVEGDAAAYGNLKALVDGYSTENSAERFALRDMFGNQAFEVLAASDNPYIQGLEKDPILSAYTVTTQLKRILADPEATEEEKAKAQELLGRY